MNQRQLLSMLTLAVLPSLTFAHPGHTDQGLSAGLLHPLGGLDHVLAMLAIGIWAALHSRRMQLATFLTALLAGFTLGNTGISLPAVETGIALSVLLLGLLIIGAARLPNGVALALTATFALFHGYAHGAEASGDLLTFAFGFILSSLALHLVGGLATYGLQQRIPVLARAVGGLIAASGAALLMF